MIAEVTTTIALMLLLITTPDRVLLARAIGHEAPRYLATEVDAEAVASVIMFRAICHGQLIREVLFAPGQFSTATLLDTDPVDVDFYLALADRAKQWESIEDLPVVASHFHAPMDSPPFWAKQEYQVEVPGTVQLYYLLPEEKCK